MAKGVSKMKEVSRVVADRLSNRDTDKQVGYLLRSVEDLADKLEGHMDREEECRARDREESKSMKSQISALTVEVSGIKKYILMVTAGIGVAGLALDKLEPSAITSLISIIGKAFL